MYGGNDDYNRRILLATILSTFLIVLWVRYYGEKTLHVENVEKVEIVETETVIPTEVTKNDTTTVVDKEEKRVLIETDKISGSINLRGLVFDTLTLKKYNNDVDSDDKVQLLNPQNTDRAQYITFSWASDDSEIELPNENTLWESNNSVLTSDTPVILTFTNKAGVVFETTVSIDEDYMFVFKQRIINNSRSLTILKINNDIVKRNIGTVVTPTTVHEGFIGCFNNKIEEREYKKLEKKDFVFDRNFDWAGLTDKYWLVSIATNKINFFDVTTNYSDKNYTVSFKSSNLIIRPNNTVEIESFMFVGPKILNLLDGYALKYNIQLFDRAVDFGWFYFLTKPMYITLKVFYNFFNNFGVAILFLTFIIKCIMYPFTKKSFVSMARMKVIQPKIEMIKNNFKDDKFQMNQKMIELYKRENISPLSGCLPTLIQIPVFFSLYKVLVITIDMRQAPFFGYIKNLAEKDPTTIWNLFGLLPFSTTFMPIGILPCLMAFTMWLQQRLTSAAGMGNVEVQTATKFLPLIFLLIFAGMPSGLLLYWVFSNTISIVQQYYVERKINYPKTKA